MSRAITLLTKLWEGSCLLFLQASFPLDDLFLSGDVSRDLSGGSLGYIGDLSGDLADVTDLSGDLEEVTDLTGVLAVETVSGDTPVIPPVIIPVIHPVIVPVINPVITLVIPPPVLGFHHRERQAVRASLTERQMFTKQFEEFKLPEYLECPFLLHSSDLSNLLLVHLWRCPVLETLTAAQLLWNQQYHSLLPFARSCTRDESSSVRAPHELQRIPQSLIASCSRDLR